ncbi:MAG: 2-oxoglutarate oxidoreductase [Clostridiales bacterium]|nr:2-oxoglutarate oxidoreductase [Clostridiales bacterium]
MAKTFRVPEIIVNEYGHGCCQGCGHGIVNRIIYEVITEMGMEDNCMAFHDLACGSNMLYAQKGNAFSGAHGRAIPTATGYKRMRPDMLVFSYAGDGATYSIGMQHTIHTALRDECMTAIVVNNTNFGMTGGQMSPASLLGQKTTSSPAGRTKELNGNPVDVCKIYATMDVAYVARGAVNNVPNVNKTKQYIKKAFEKQMAGEGFTFVEVIAACPTNWGMTPAQANARIADEVLAQFPMGEFVERSAK